MKELACIVGVMLIGYAIVWSVHNVGLTANERQLLFLENERAEFAALQEEFEEAQERAEGQR